MFDDSITRFSRNAVTVVLNYIYVNVKYLGYYSYQNFPSLSDQLYDLFIKMLGNDVFIAISR